MDYLTNYYKNLSEQLQERINNLEKLIEKRETEEVIIDDSVRDEGEYHPTLQGRLAKGKGSKKGRFVNVEPGNALPGVSKQAEVHDAHELADEDATGNNVWNTKKPIKVNKSAISPSNYNDELKAQEEKEKSRRKTLGKIPDDQPIDAYNTIYPS